MTHKWKKSTLGHGESQCEYCFATNREIAVIGDMNFCPDAPTEAVTAPNGFWKVTCEGEETTKASELAPCPFCGGEAELREGDECGYVQCLSASYHKGPFLYGDNNAAAEAIAAWNTRAPLPNEGELVEIVAITIFEAMQAVYQHENPTGISYNWVNGGNSIMQDKARQKASAIITALRPYLNDGKRVAELTEAIDESADCIAFLNAEGKKQDTRIAELEAALGKIAEKDPCGLRKFDGAMAAVSFYSTARKALKAGGRVDENS